MDWPNFSCSLKRLHFTLILGFLGVGCVYLGSTNEFTAVLNPLKQTDCITKCQNGLLAKVDRLVLTGKIYIKDPVPAQGTVASLQLKLSENTEPHDFVIVALDNCSDHGPNKSFHCEKTDRQNVFNVYLNMTADAAFSEKEVGIRVSTYENSELGNFIKLPKIYNLQNAVLTLNGHTLSQGCPNIELEKETSEITLCCKNMASPCEAIIHHMGVTQVKAKDCVRYKIPEGAIRDFTFTFEACSQPNLAHSYRCQLKVVQNGKESGSDDVTFTIILPVISIVAFILGVPIICLCCRRNNVITLESDINRSKVKTF